MYEIIASEIMKKIYDDLDSSEREWIDKIKRKLEKTPTGKPLGFSWFREKKYLNKRLYYVVDEETKKILLVAFAPKKQQQEMINHIKENMNELFRYIRTA